MKWPCSMAKPSIWVKSKPPKMWRKWGFALLQHFSGQSAPNWTCDNCEVRARCVWFVKSFIKCLAGSCMTTVSAAGKSMVWSCATGTTHVFFLDWQYCCKKWARRKSTPGQDVSQEKAVVTPRSRSNRHSNQHSSCTCGCTSPRDNTLWHWTDANGWALVHDVPQCL